MSPNKFDNSNPELFKQSFTLIRVDNFQPDKHTLKFQNTQLHPYVFEGTSAYFQLGPQNKTISERDFTKSEGTSSLEIIKPATYFTNPHTSQLVNEQSNYQSQIHEKPLIMSGAQNKPQITEEFYPQNNEMRHVSGKQSSQIKREPDIIKAIRRDKAFTSTQFDKSIIKKLKDKGVTYAIFFDKSKQEEFFSWQKSENKKIPSNLIKTVLGSADKQETLEEILLFYENEILYIENNSGYVDLKFNE